MPDWVHAATWNGVRYEMEEVSLKCPVWYRPLILPVMRDDVASELVSDEIQMTPEGREFTVKLHGVLVEATRRLEALGRN